jgi:hypothetical protein
MAQIQKTGRVFVLVTKQNVGTTNASFADKNVILSGKGIDSGADFGTKVTVKAGTRGRNPDGATIGLGGGLNYPVPPQEVDPKDEDRIDGVDEGSTSPNILPQIKNVGFQGSVQGRAALKPYVMMSINFGDGRGFLDIKNSAKSVQLSEASTLILRVSVAPQGNVRVSNISLTPTGRGIALGAGAKQVDEEDSPKDFNIVTQLANNITTQIIQINATVEEASDPAGEADEGSPNLGLRDAL